MAYFPIHKGLSQFLDLAVRCAASIRYIYKDGATGDARDREEREEEQTIEHKRHLAPLRLVAVVDLGASVVLVKFFVDLADVCQ